MGDMQQDIGTEGKGAQIGTAENVFIGANPSASNGTPKHLTVLPAKNPKFVGREAELKQINEDLAKDSMVYIVNGIGGIGKSELAFKYLHDHEASYQHIALFEFSGANDSLEDVLITALNQSLYLDEHASLDSILYRLQQLPTKSLLVFDNLQRQEDIEKLEPLNNNCDVLITTRLSQLSQQCLNLDILSKPDARALFQQYYPTNDSIDDILEYIDYHSLFIELIAKTLQEGCLTLEALRDKFRKGEFSKIDRDYTKSFNDFLIQRFQIEADEALKQLLQKLALLPSIEISTETLEEIFSDDVRIKLKLNELAKRGWLIQRETSYKLHQIIKEFILANHPTDLEVASPVFESISQLLDPNDAYLNPVEKTHYIEIIESILKVYPLEQKAAIASLLDSLSNLYYSLGRYDKALSFQKKALEIREEVLGDKHPDIASSYNNMASVYDSQGNYPKALELNQKALKIRETVLGDKHPDTAASYNNICKDND